METTFIKNVSDPYYPPMLAYLLELLAPLLGRDEACERMQASV